MRVTTRKYPQTRVRTIGKIVRATATFTHPVKRVGLKGWMRKPAFGRYFIFSQKRHRLFGCNDGVAICEARIWTALSARHNGRARVDLVAGISFQRASFIFAGAQRFLLALIGSHWGKTASIARLTIPTSWSISGSEIINGGASRM